jgi:plastocyanin
MFRRIAFLVFCLSLTASALKAADHVVTQKGKAFSQVEITVAPGDTITFKNDDDVTHNVFSNSKPLEFDLKTQAPGKSSTVPFAVAGAAEVRCAIHPKMKLMVTVKK